MRAAVLHHMGEFPMPLSSNRFFDGIVARLFPLQPAYAAFVVVILSMSSVAYAAEYALPGDLLYFIKIHVNEELSDVMVLTPQEKAQREADRTTQRLDEAFALIAKNKLDAARTEDVQHLFLSQARVVEERIQSLLRRDLEKSALQVLLAYEGSLAAHELVLADIVERDPNLATIAGKLVEAINEEGESVSESGEAISVALLRNGQSIDSAVESARVTTQIHLKRIESVSAEIFPILPQAEVLRIDGELRKARAGLHESEARLESGASAQALQAVRSSLRSAEEATLRLHMGKAKVVPESSLRFLPDSRREIRNRTDVREQRREIRHDILGEAQNIP